LIEGDEGSARRPATQVHRVSEFHPVRRKCESGCHGCFILDLDVSQTEHLRECIADNALIKSVQAAEDPAGFQQYGFRDPDWPGREQRPHSGFLFGVIPGQQPNQHISIDRGHDVESPRVQ